MKYLITGTNGFIGYHLVNKLSENSNNTIFAIDRKEANFNKTNVTELVIDLKDKIKVLPDVDVVIHLAAFNGTKHFYSKALDVIKDNIIPTLNLIDYYKTRNIKRFVYAGTPESTAGATEHFNYKIPTDEKCPFVVSDPKNKRWSYANSKALGEQAVIASDMPYTIIRYNNVYGPRQIDHFISEFFDRINKCEYSLYGYDNTRTFLYIDDAIEATELLLNCNKAVNEIFNVGGDKEQTIKSIAETILKLMNINAPIVLYPAPEGSTMRRWPDVTKLKEYTGFKQRISIEEGLKRTLNI